MVETCELRLVGRCKPGYARPQYRDWFLVSSRSSGLDCTRRRTAWARMACPFGYVEMRMNGVESYLAPASLRRRPPRLVPPPPPPPLPPPPPPPPPPATLESPHFALGVLSTVRSFGCKPSGGVMRCRTTLAQAAARRARLRDEYHRSRIDPRSMVLRFVVADACGVHCPAREPYMRRPSRAALAAAEREAARHGDVVRLNATEDPLGGCSLKYLLWLEVALERWPTAVFIALADDDEYIQFPHLEAELRRVAQHERLSAEELILWGTIFWRPYVNAVTMSPAEILHLEVERTVDDGAVSKERYRIERCRRSLQLAQPPQHGETSSANAIGANAIGANAIGANAIGANAIGASVNGVARSPMNPGPAASLTFCSPRKLSPARRGEVERGEVWRNMPPTPMANGALFAVSRSLARLLTGPLGIPRRWLQHFKRTELIRFARSRRRIPFRLKDAGCWPNGDATFGAWVMLLGQERPERRISLIDMPLWVSSHPEPPTKRSRAFGNSSIVLHGLKGNSTDWLWEDAQQRGAGPYEPPPSRRCDTCRKMGWATWPGSVAKAWRCCGRAVRRRAIRLDPRTVDEGMNTTAWSQEEQRLRLAAMRRGGLQR